MEPLTPMEQSTAIFHYWLTISWAWAVAIVLDFSPLIFLWIMSIISDGRKEEELAEQQLAAVA